MKYDFKGNIYLIGFMGSGKSTVGPLVAKKLGRAFLDTDEAIEQKSGKSISEIFSESGELEFRKLENQTIQNISKLSEMVVSVGGGALMYPENWILLKESGVTIYLKCDLDVLWARLKNSFSRPLINMDRNKKYERIAELIKEREPFYQMADLEVEISKHFSIEKTADSIMKKLKGKNEISYC